MRAAMAALIAMAACGGPVRPVATGNAAKPPPTTPARAQDVQVAGKVVDAKTKEPLPGATVIVVLGPDGKNVLSSVCDEHGVFGIGDVPPGPHDVTAYYNDEQTTQSVVVPSVQATNMVFAMKVGGTVVIPVEGQSKP